MRNGWTGGQYSLVRVLTAVLVAAVVIAEAAAGGAVRVSVGMGLLVLAGVFAVGWRGRVVALTLAAGLVVMAFVLDDAHARDGLEVWGVLLLVGALVWHARLPWRRDAPYGSVDARGRVDPGGGWRFPPWLFRSVWLGLGAFYLIAGIVLLQDESWRLAEALFYDGGRWAVLPWVGTMPAWLGRTLTWLLLGTWLGFGPLALARRNRRLAWALPLGVNLLVLPLAGYWELAAALTAVHLLAFNPMWLRPSVPASPETVFYDGDCGLCHRAVRFVLAEDGRDEPFVLSPLGSAHFRERASAVQRERLPDSMVVQCDHGELLTRSTAVLHMLDRLGGWWRVMAMVGGAVPAAWRDALYDGVAAVRHRWFARPSEACPVMPAGLRGRFRM